MKLGKLIGYNLTTKRMDDNSLLVDAPVKVFETTVDDVNYEDISSMENWDNSDVLDWARRRNEISPLFYAIANTDLSTYSNLTASEKLIGAQYFFAPYSLRVTNSIVTETEDLENWDFLLTQSKENRERVVEYMRHQTGQYVRTEVLTLAQTQDFFKDVFELSNWFIEANIPDFKQWLTNEVGSIYETAGFAEKAYYSSGLKDELIDIYNGKY